MLAFYIFLRASSSSASKVASNELRPFQYYSDAMSLSVSTYSCYDSSLTAANCLPDSLRGRPDVLVGGEMGENDDGEVGDLPVRLGVVLSEPEAYSARFSFVVIHRPSIWYH